MKTENKRRADLANFIKLCPSIIALNHKSDKLMLIITYGKNIWYHSTYISSFALSVKPCKTLNVARNILYYIVLICKEHKCFVNELATLSYLSQHY